MEKKILKQIMKAITYLIIALLLTTMLISGLTSCGKSTSEVNKEPVIITNKIEEDTYLEEISRAVTSQLYADADNEVYDFETLDCDYIETTITTSDNVQHNIIKVRFELSYTTPMVIMGNLTYWPVFPIYEATMDIDNDPACTDAHVVNVELVSGGMTK